MMAVDRRRFIQLSAGSAAMSMFSIHAAGDTGMRKLPIIDVHMHAYPADMALPEAANPATGKLTGLKNGEAHMQVCLAEMKRLNIVKGVVSGGDGDRLACARHLAGGGAGLIPPG